MKKPILVVGASGKIGREIAGKLASMGYVLILQCNRNCDVLEGIRKYSKQRIHILKHDFLSDGIDGFIEKVQNVVREPPGTAVLSIGVYDDTVFAESTEQKVLSILTTNLAVHIRIIESLAMWMREDGGTIIVLTDVTPLRGPDVYCGLKPSLHYLAASAGVHALIRSAPSRLPANVHVVGVALGWVEGNHIPRRIRACIEKSVPAGKTIPVQDVVNVVLSIAEVAELLNGEVIEVTGGL